jgi:hypothetical protein
MADHAAAITTLRLLVGEIETRLEHQQHWRAGEPEQQRKLLGARRLELAHLLAQQNARAGKDPDS